MAPNILVTSSGRHVLASKPRGGSTSYTPESEGTSQSEGGPEVELDREDLIMLINHHARLTIEEWWQKYQLPLHNQNVRKLDEVTDALNKAKGAYWAFGIAIGALVIVIQHFWK